MLKANNLVGFNSVFTTTVGSAAVAVSLEDHGNISTLPASVSLGNAVTGRLIVIAYHNAHVGSGSIPSDTTLTLGGNAMTRVATLTSGLSGSPQTDGYKCTFYYLQVNTGTSATLARSGGDTSGAFQVFRLTGQLSNVPAHTDGVGTTTAKKTSLSRTIAIPANGCLIASAYVFPSTNNTFTGASQVLNGNSSAATSAVVNADVSHTVTVQHGGEGGDLFFIVGTWG